MKETTELKELKEENSRLKSELEKAKEQTGELEKSRSAMLFMLEDLNESTARVAKAKGEWEATFDAISDPLFIHGKEFKIVRTNRAYAEAAGMSFPEIIGKPYYEVFPKMDGPFKMCKMALELQEEEEEEEEEEFSCPLTNRIFKVRFYPIKDVNGGYLYSIHIIEDITERRRTEERYKMIVQTAMEGFWLIDTQGRILDVNDALCKMLGYTRDELLTMSIPDVEVVESPEEIAQHIRRIIEKGWDRFETLHRCKDGRVIDIDVSVYYMKIDDGRFFAFTRDITERKEAEKRIKEEMEVTAHLLMIAEATAHTTDVNKLMEQVAHCGHEIIKCDVCLSYVWNEDGKVFQPSQHSGLAHDRIPLFRTEPLDKNAEFVKKTMEGKEPMLIQLGIGSSESGVPNKQTTAPNSELQTPNYFPWLPGINTIAAIPLIGRIGYLGLLIAIYKNAKEFTQRDRKIMQGISNQVSTALEQARLYKETVNKSMELSHKIETIQVMNEIDKSILSTLEQQEILEITVRLISRIIPCDRAAVALVHREKKSFSYAAGFGIAFLSKGQMVPFEDTNATEVMETGRPQYVSNMAGAKDLPPLERKFLEQGFLSHIRVPLMVKNEVVGVLNVGSKRPSSFTKEDLATLEKIAAQISVALENARLVTDLNELFIGTVRSLSSAIDAKSSWTAGHSERVTQYAVEIAKNMGFDEKALKDLELAGFLHDVGKIGTYETILDKPGKLTDEELKLMRQHPVKGAEILAPIKQLKNIIPAIKYHHEFYDGTGYPEGLKGEAIPLSARILTVADTIDAMGADRPYRKGRSMDVIVEELKRCSGTQFDPKVVEVFLGMTR